MRAFYNKLLLSDHGFLRLKQALKTLLVLCLSIAALYQQPLMVKVSACMVTGFGMQCIVGTEQRSQLLSSILAFISLTLCYALGMLSKHIDWMPVIILTIGAFFSFYIQRIGNGYLFTGLFSWSMIFVGTIFPTNSFLAIGQNILGCIISSGIALIINFLIWPRDPKKIFLNNLENYLLISQECIQRLEKSFSRITLQDNAKFLQEEGYRLRQSILLNQTIIEQIDQYQKDHINHPLRQVFAQQFSLGKAISMLLESSDQLQVYKREIPPAIKKTIAQLLRYFLVQIQNRQLLENQQIIVFPHLDSKIAEEHLNELKTLICHKNIKHDYFIYLVNLHLGFRYLLTSLLTMENAS